MINIRSYINKLFCQNAEQNLNAMDEKIIQELSEVIQSSNINFLLGAGSSCPFLPLLGNIEQRLNETQDSALKEIEYKRYFESVMLPNISILKETAISPAYIETKTNYDNFFLALSQLLVSRKSTILSKQINLFTTNIDVFVETSLERLLIEYNDGFSGRFNPTFSPANYKKTIQQRSLHFDHITEIPTFNIIKLHGSLTWKKSNSDDKIHFSHILDHFETDLHNNSGDDFTNGYKQILVVNPEESKHLESVLNIYYSELLRIYSSELEKENAMLFIIGFSMDDKHIREITLRASKANPTLRIFVCCSKSSESGMKYKLETQQHQNIHILTSGDGGIKFTLDFFTKNILNKLI